MKKKIVLLVIIIVLIYIFNLFVFNSSNTIEDTFNSVIRSDQQLKIDDFIIYEKIEKESYGIILFTNHNDETQTSLAYFEKNNSEWQWVGTANCTSPQWSSARMGEDGPYIYCVHFMNLDILRL